MIRVVQVELWILFTFLMTRLNLLKTSRNTIERDILTHPLLRDKKPNFIPFKFQTISAMQQSTPK